MKKILQLPLFLLPLLFLPLLSQGQTPIPAKKQSKSILLMNGTAHLGNGTVIQSSVVGFINGKITLVKNAKGVTLDKTVWDTIIDCTGKQIYPGFIAPNSTLGLTD